MRITVYLGYKEGNNFASPPARESRYWDFQGPVTIDSWQSYIETMRHMMMTYARIWSGRVSIIYLLAKVRNSFTRAVG